MDLVCTRESSTEKWCAPAIMAWTSLGTATTYQQNISLIVILALCSKNGLKQGGFSEREHSITLLPALPRVTQAITHRRGYPYIVLTPRSIRYILKVKGTYFAKLMKSLKKED